MLRGCATFQLTDGKLKPRPPSQIAIAPGTTALKCTACQCNGQGAGDHRGGAEGLPHAGHHGRRPRRRRRVGRRRAEGEHGAHHRRAGDQAEVARQAQRPCDHAALLSRHRRHEFQQLVLDEMAVTQEPAHCEVRYAASWTGISLPLSIVDAPLAMANLTTLRETVLIC